MTVVFKWGICRYLYLICLKWSSKSGKIATVKWSQWFPYIPRFSKNIDFRSFEQCSRYEWLESKFCEKNTPINRLSRRGDLLPNLGIYEFKSKLRCNSQLKKYFSNLRVYYFKAVQDIEFEFIPFDSLDLFSCNKS